MSNENEKVTRKLRAILSADVKGYSLLMADDEVHTIQTLKTYRNLMSDLIEQHSGRVVDNPGDNLLAEFSSAVDAVEASVQIQNKLLKENAKFVEGKRLRFRIGVNIGDVVHDGDRIYGSGVNVAARIEGIADPGGICISRNTYDQVKDKLDLGFEYLGEHEVKNIEEPVRVYKILMGVVQDGQISTKKKTSKLRRIAISGAILIVSIFILGGGIYWKFLYLSEPEDIDPNNVMTFDLPKGPSIIVLPFDNMTGNKEDEYLCDGITENIISALSYVPQLFVIARNTSFTYKGKKIDVKQVGGDLNVQYLLEGSIQKAPDNIRVTVQLISTETEYHIWSKVFDRNFNDLFKIQDEVAYNIAQAMQINITEGNMARSRFSGISDIQTYFRLLKAYDHFQRMTIQDNLLAQKEAYEIVETDPNVYGAYTLLAGTYLMDLWFGSCSSNIVCFAKIKEMSDIALKLNSSNSDAYFIRGLLFYMSKSLENAVTSFKKAIHLNPNNAEAYSFLGDTYQHLGHANKGIEFAKKAVELDPIPMSGFWNHLGHAYTLAKQYDKAIETYEMSLKTQPKDLFAYINLAYVYVLLGNQDVAKKMASKVMVINPNFSLKKFTDTVPTRDRERIKQYYNGLKKAGLPD